MDKRHTAVDFSSKCEVETESIDSYFQELGYLVWKRGKERKRHRNIGSRATFFFKEERHWYVYILREQRCKKGIVETVQERDASHCPAQNSPVSLA